MTFRVSLLTIESDSPDPAIMSAIRELLERAGVRSAVVVSTPNPGAPAPPSETPAPARETKRARPSCPLFPPCKPCRDDQGTCDARQRKAPAEPKAAPVPTTAEREPVIDGEFPEVDEAPATPAAPVSDDTRTRVLELLARRSGLRPSDVAVELYADDSQGAALRAGRVLRSMVDGGLLEMRKLNNGSPAYSLAGAVRVQSPPREAPVFRVHAPRGEPMPVSDPTGHVSGFPTPSAVPGSLAERIVQAVIAKPGTTQHELAVELLGEATAANVRRIDMLLGPLAMSSKLARYNGRVFETVAQAGKMKLPPPGRADTRRGPGQGAAPLAQVQTQKELFDKIVAAFGEDHATPVPDLARELFGESTGRAVDKLQLMLRQLCSSKRLLKLPGGGFRPIGDDERAGVEEADEDEDAEDDSDDDQELESNGAPDEDAVEELDLS